MTKQEKEDLQDEITNILSGKFDGMDAVRLIRNNPHAERLLKKCSFCDYDEELRFIEEHDDCEIRTVLETPHSEYYDPDYGSLDPLCGFRVHSTKVIQDPHEIYEYDNLFTHILTMLEEEIIEIPKEEVLTRENLEMLLNGEADCKVDHIYFFDKTGESSFHWEYYFHNTNGEWDSMDVDVDFTDIEGICDIFNFRSTTPGDIANEFYNYFRNYYTMFPGLAQKKYNDPITEADIFNGPEAICLLQNTMNAELRSNIYKISRKIQERREDSEQRARMRNLVHTVREMISHMSQQELLLLKIEAQNYQNQNQMLEPEYAEKLKEQESDKYWTILATNLEMEKIFAREKAMQEYKAKKERKDK